MTDLTASQRALILQAHDDAQARILDFQIANDGHPSELREALITDLVTHQDEINGAGFFEEGKSFTDQEIELLLAVAESIGVVLTYVDDVHVLLLIRMQTDLARFIQNLSLGSALLRMHWLRAQHGPGALRLPRDIPEEVSDDFAVTAFSRIQGYFNITAAAAAKAIERRCLNGDDYSSLRAGVTVSALEIQAATDVIQAYVEREALRRAAAEAPSEEGFWAEVGGIIWSVFGWDDPADFATDLVIFIASDGIGKIVEWADRFKAVRDRVRKAEKILAGYKKLAQEVVEIEKRIVELRSRAGRVARFVDLARLPTQLFDAALDLVKNDADKLIADTAGVLKEHLRGITSTIAARAATGQQLKAGKALTEEAARSLVDAYISSWPFARDLPAMRDKLSFSRLLRGPDRKGEARKFVDYLARFTAKELLARVTVVQLRKQPVTPGLLAEKLVDSFGAAVENVAKTLLRTKEAKWVRDTVISAAGQILTELGKRLFKEAFGDGSAATSSSSRG